ncbi:uncharacterized protein [Chironomus tepperi]|uniref:uncharacterized protein n=1 Tax=Chironomus tepperi TaxID=113505 RepID=UPI00391F6290
MLKLANNDIYELPGGVFGSLKYLATLDMTNNQLQVISSTSFYFHPDLRTVRFGQNQINSIDEKFLDVVNVTQLNMEQNICADGFWNDDSETKELFRTELRVCFENYIEPPQYCPIGNEYERICELEAQTASLTLENASIRRDLEGLAARIEQLERLISSSP